MWTTQLHYIRRKVEGRDGEEKKHGASLGCRLQRVDEWTSE